MCAPAVVPLSQDFIKVIHVNINSARRKLDLITNYVEEQSPSIFALTESWLDSGLPSSDYKIPEYEIFRNDRDLTVIDGDEAMQGGGILCYIHKSLKGTILLKSDNEDMNETEFLIIEVVSSMPNSSSTSKLLLAVVYWRPGGFTLSSFFAKLDEFAQSVI